MSRAFGKVGLVSKQETNVCEIPNELLPYTEQIKEITRLGNLFTQHKVPVGLLDLGTTLAFNAMRKRGELTEAYNFMLDSMKKVASENGLN